MAIVASTHHGRFNTISPDSVHIMVESSTLTSQQSILYVNFRLHDVLQLSSFKKSDGLAAIGFAMDPVI